MVLASRLGINLGQGLSPVHYLARRSRGGYAYYSGPRHVLDQKPGFKSLFTTSPATSTQNWNNKPRATRTLMSPDQFQLAAHKPTRTTAALKPDIYAAGRHKQQTIINHLYTNNISVSRKTQFKVHQVKKSIYTTGNLFRGVKQSIAILKETLRIGHCHYVELDRYKSPKLLDADLKKSNKIGLLQKIGENDYFCQYDYAMGVRLTIHRFRISPTEVLQSIFAEKHFSAN
jgi:hypothetical protein